MRTLLWFSYFWISLFCLTPSMLCTYWLNRTGRISMRDAIVQRCVRGWMRSLLWLAGVTATIEGLDEIPNQPVLFVSNHQGNFDIPILLCGLNRAHGIVAKAQLRKLPFIRVWMRYFGCVFLERDNPRQSLEALDHAAANLQNGLSMVVFPEGTRSRGRPMAEFKGGAFRIAAKTKVPIIPVCIEGSYRAMEAQGFWIQPANVRVRLLHAIETASLSRRELKELPEQVQKLINRQLSSMQEDFSA